jgi:hypothetical protein
MACGAASTPTRSLVTRMRRGTASRNIKLNIIRSHNSSLLSTTFAIIVWIARELTGQTVNEDEEINEAHRVETRDGVCRPVARGMQVVLCVRPVQPWRLPLRICRISKTNLLISPLRNVRHPTASTCYVCWIAVVGNNSFTKIFVYTLYKLFCTVLWSALCNLSVDFAFLTKALFTLIHISYNIYSAYMFNRSQGGEEYQTNNKEKEG